MNPTLFPISLAITVDTLPLICALLFLSIAACFLILMISLLPKKGSYQLSKKHSPKRS
ncbi:hypothetical protein STRIC_1759 [Streptococcus ictaluri 707-05]|uniref:Uncharacterized protein n=1 Tax=Streptococcus ictaluri 707-05 TaxID=764299 RepID=G5K4M2_9STRE|nr:hypothetical protein STRIC_1759 [Streptococcus ictaluri 707-05]